MQRITRLAEASEVAVGDLGQRLTEQSRAIQDIAIMMEDIHHSAGSTLEQASQQEQLANRLVDLSGTLDTQLQQFVRQPAS